MKPNLGISDSARKNISDGLSRLMADSYSLYLKTHSFHWNVTGPLFSQLHAQFMEQYTELWNAVDEIAERIRALGFWAPGSYSEFGKLTTISEARAPLSSKEMIQQLLEGHETVARTARSVFPMAQEGQDEATVELLTQRIQLHEKMAWMLRAQLES